MVDTGINNIGILNLNSRTNRPMKMIIIEKNKWINSDNKIERISKVEKNEHSDIKFESKIK